MNTLDERLEEALEALKIPEEQQQSLRMYTSLVKAKDEATYYHCVRCGILGMKIAERMLLDQKALFYAGLLHDVGKALIDPEILQMTEGFGPKEYEKMKHHPGFGYELLKGNHEFSAEVIVRHHAYSAKGYPKKMPTPRKPWSLQTKALINYYARLLSIIDFYDAAAMRENDKFGQKKKLAKEEVKELLLKSSRGMEITISGLYEAKILGNEALFEEQIETYKECVIPKLVKAHEDSLSLSERISKNVMLACALEPIPDKPGCTTRYRDLGNNKTLEMFVAAGINIGQSFVKLAKYTERNKTPQGAYQFLKEAMIASKCSRAGGKINQGILEFFTPIVIANVLYDPHCQGKPEDLLQKAVEICKNTCKKDVKSLIETKTIGNKMSGVEDKYPVRKHDAANVYDYYAKELEVDRAEKHPTSIVHNVQFVEGFQDIGLALKTFQESKETKFSSKITEAYNAVMQKYDKKIGVGLAADFTAVMLYLVLMYSKGEEIIN